MVKLTYKKTEYLARRKREKEGVFMRKMKKFVLACCMAAGLLMFAPQLLSAGLRTTAEAAGSNAAAGWHRDSQGRYYYLNANRVRVTGWQKLGNNWYYFDGSGYRQTGWVRSGRSTYYLDPASGIMCTGWRRIGGSYYYFNPGGTMRTGWLQIGQTWYYLQYNGVMATGWQRVGQTWYCFSGSGKMYANTWLRDKGNGKYYFVTSSGAMATGWLNRGGNWYYLNPGSGEMLTGWRKVSGKTYFMNTNGTMATGWKKWNGYWYYLEPGSGAMKTNLWLLQNNKWYYLNGNGTMRTGWLTLGGKKYFFGSDGVMYSNQWNGDEYLSADGAWVKNYSADVAKLRVAKTATQIIKIEARGTGCVLTLHQKYPNGTWKQVGRCTGYVGMGGVDKKRENDRKTPSGIFTVRQAFGTLANPGTTLKYTKLNNNWYWCRNAASVYYNKLVSTAGGYKASAADLRLNKYPDLYAYALDIGYNVAGDSAKGSAIFLHTGSKATSIGGIAVSRGAMATTLKWVKTGAKVIIGTPGEIAKY